jgi:hypothetical protein
VSAGPATAELAGRETRRGRMEATSGTTVRFVGVSYPYQIDNRYLPVLALFGFRPKKDSVTIDDGHFLATFGLFRLTTELTNIDGAHVTRNYRWWTAVGPRMSFADDGLTFGTNNHAGVCVHFKEKVPSALRRKGHSALTVTVADLDGLVLALDPSSRT